MASPTEVAHEPVLLEYDYTHAGARVLIAMALLLGPLWGDRGYSLRGFSIDPQCHGHWAGGLQFLAFVLGPILAIEIVDWKLWQHAHRSEILPLEQQNAPRGLPAFAPRFRSAFRPATPRGVSAPDDPGYRLVKAGGELPGAPRHLLSGVIFASCLMIAALPLVSFNTCQPQAFSFGLLVGFVLLDYGALSLGNVAALYPHALDRYQNWRRPWP